MNKILTYISISFLTISVNSVSFSQRNKSKKSDDIAVYSENLTSSLPIFEAFKAPENVVSKQIKTDTVNKKTLNKNDDTESIDSVTEVLKKYYSNKTKAKGWRIQIWDGQTHTDMKEIISSYNNTFRDLDLILHDDYDKTLFRVRIGDFTDRLEAFRYLQVIKKEFPNALLVPDQVELSKI